MIALNRPLIAANETKYLSRALESAQTAGGGTFYKQAKKSLQEILGSEHVFLTQSCTSALELAALALNVGPGDEVIVPSYTFVTSASAFTLRGAKIVYVEVDPSNLSIDFSQLRKHISPRTKAMVLVHYGGSSHNVDQVAKLCQEKGIFLVEDCAHAIGGSHRGKPLGTWGDLACFSFHGTKNISSGEGGCLVVNSQSEDLLRRASLAHEKGTNRADFALGRVSKYEWLEQGSSFIPSEFTTAALSAQLEQLEEVNHRRRNYYREYKDHINELNLNKVKTLELSEEEFSAHAFVLLVEDKATREKLIQLMSDLGVVVASHYEPLHSSPFSIRHFGQVKLPVTEDIAGRVLRLPMWSAPGLDTKMVADSLSKSLIKLGVQ